MKNRIIIRGFFNQSTETHTHTLPTPQRPIGFDYTNRNTVSNDEDMGEISGFDLDVASIGFMESIKRRL